MSSGPRPFGRGFRPGLGERRAALQPAFSPACQGRVGHTDAVRGRRSARSGCTGGRYDWWMVPAPAKSELRAMSRLAAPIVLAELGWMAMGVVDTMVVGRVGAG